MTPAENVAAAEARVAAARARLDVSSAALQRRLKPAAVATALKREASEHTFTIAAWTGGIVAVLAGTILLSRRRRRRA